MNFTNIKSWNINLNCLMFCIPILIGAYWIYINIDSDFENQRFNSNVTESLKVLNALNKNKIDDLKVSHSLFIIASINNVNLNKFIPHDYLCNQIVNINVSSIINNLDMQPSFPEIQKKQFHKKYQKLKQLCIKL